MKNVDELTGGESCVCVLCFYEDVFSGSVLIFCVRFVHSRIFDITHNGDRNVVTLKRTVDTSWIPEQQAFILTKESSVSNFKMSEALGTLEAISSIIFLCVVSHSSRHISEKLVTTLDTKFSVLLQK